MDSMTVDRWTATNSAGYPAPAALAVDVVAFAVRDGTLRVLVAEDEAGACLPGVLLTAEESPEAGVRRTLREKAGLEDARPEQLATFADPGRDPRGWIPTIAHLALLPPDAGPVAPGTAWRSARRPPRLLYDHADILATARDRLEGKLWWSNVARGALPETWAMSEARSVYEAVAGTRYDPGSFARDLRATGLIEPTGTTAAGRPGRPAALWRFTSTEPRWGAGRRKRIES